MKLQAAIESLIGLSNGGVITDEIRQSMPYMESVANTFRGLVISSKYNGTRTLAKNNRINPLYYVKHYPLYVSSAQDDDCCVKFECPQIMSLDELSDGLRYCGTISGSKAYYRIHSRKRLSDINTNRITRAIVNDNVSFLYDGFLGTIEVYGNEDVEEILLEIIPQNVLDCNGFNRDVDEFIADDDKDLFLSMNFAQQGRIEKSVPPDLISNSNDM